MRLLRWLLAVAAISIPASTRAEEEPKVPAAEKPAEDEVPTRDLRAGGDEKKRYFLIGPKEGDKGPKGGFRVLLVMPGGDGSAEFRPFVTNMRRRALSDEWIVAQMVSVKWTDDQETIWPTKGDPVPKMAFSTEEFAKAVVEDVAKRHPIDAKKVFSLSWSSSGPAAYAIALTEKTPVRGSYVAMSVYVPKRLPPRSKAKGHRFLIDHSRGDDRCPFAMAETARDELEKAGAKVKFTTYEGGHGWHGNVFGRIRTGIAWLADEEGKGTGK